MFDFDFIHSAIFWGLVVAFVVWLVYDTRPRRRGSGAKPREATRWIVPQTTNSLQREVNGTYLSGGYDPDDDREGRIRKNRARIKPPASLSEDLHYVYRAVDGDTIHIDWRGNPVVVRLVGIDAPETVHPYEPSAPFGPEASKATKKLVARKYVRIETDGELDPYGRLLAAVWLEDGLMLNHYLVRNGFAREMTYDNRPCKYRDLFVQAEEKARQEAVGMWGRSVGAHK